MVSTLVNIPSSLCIFSLCLSDFAVDMSDISLETSRYGSSVALERTHNFETPIFPIVVACGALRHNCTVYCIEISNPKRLPYIIKPNFHPLRTTLIMSPKKIHFCTFRIQCAALTPWKLKWQKYVEVIIL
jgi:hypothetical protein